MQLKSLGPYSRMTDLVMQYSGGTVVLDGMKANLNFDIVLGHRWGLYAQMQDPQPRPTAGRAVLKPHTLRKRAKYAARLHAQLSSVKRRLRSPSLVPLRLCSKGSAQYAESGRRQAETQKRSRSKEQPAGRRWWCVEQQRREAAAAPLLKQFRRAQRLWRRP